MKILYAGGGTLGPVTPLLAVHEAFLAKYKQNGYSAVWAGTRHGIERELVDAYHIPFYRFFSGKLRRYADVRNISDLALIAMGFFQACIFLLSKRPQVIVSAGGFVAVPLIWAGWLLGIPSVIFQLDRRVGLANRLSAPFAHTIFLSGEDIALGKKGQSKVIGIPVRSEVERHASIGASRKTTLKKKYGFSSTTRIVLAVGGGTGSLRLNENIVDAIAYLDDTISIVHITGKGKGSQGSARLPKRLIQKEFLKEELLDYMAMADCIISRAGMGFLSEITTLGIPLILVPIASSHQEDNATYVSDHHAGLVLNERDMNGKKLAAAIKGLLGDAQQVTAMLKAQHGLFGDHAASRAAVCIHDAILS